MNAILQAIQNGKFLATQKMQAFAHDLRTYGWKKTFSRYGWRLFAIIFVAYLIRDVTLYILIPWFIARSFIQ